MKIFLTGATGFLGSRVLSFFEGHELLCLTRNVRRFSKARHVRSLAGDLSDPAGWRNELKKFAPEWCVHLAWEGLPDYSLVRCRANLDAGIGLVETLADVGIKRMVMAGTCWEYGSASGAVKEDQPPTDCGLFAVTKHSLQTVLASVARDCGFEYRWGRIFFAYGPGQRASSLIGQCHAAYVQGRQPDIRNPGLAQDFIFIDDVAQALAVLTTADTGSGVFNIGSGVPTTVASVVNRVAAHFDKPSPFPEIKATAGFWADTSKTTAATGWTSSTSTDDGIRQTLQALDRQ